MNPFAAPTDYPGVLNKVGLSTFIASVGCVYLLRGHIPAAENALSLAGQVPIVGLTVPTGTVLAALAIALTFRIVKFHDRLSDLFRIRANFDRNWILLPLACLSGGLKGKAQARDLAHKRSFLMREVFYRYASSAQGESAISKNTITLAVDAWGWYWCLLEAITVAFATAVALLLAGAHRASAWLLVAAFAAMAVLRHVRSQCEEYATQEVEQILEDDGRRLQIRSTFDAL